MKSFVLLSLLSFSAFADDAYNRCLNGWQTLDGKMNEERISQCEEPVFKSCMATYMRSNDRMPEFRVNICYRLQAQQHVISDKKICEHGWLESDGVLNYSRSKLCEEKIFSQCVADYIRAGYTIEAGIIRYCKS